MFKTKKCFETVQTDVNNRLHTDVSWTICRKEKSLQRDIRFICFCFWQMVGTLLLIRRIFLFLDLMSTVVESNFHISLYRFSLPLSFFFLLLSVSLFMSNHIIFLYLQAPSKQRKAWFKMPLTKQVVLSFVMLKKKN